MPEEPKKVVYLLGTGASHAVIKFYDPANEGILMPDIAEVVLNKLKNEDDPSLKELYSIPESKYGERYPDVDIESIITLYESSGTDKDKKRTNKLRQLFRLAINKRINRALKTSNGVPDMITALIDMHLLPDHDERLHAILTINYDNFIEKSMIENYGRVNLPFEVVSVDNQYAIDDEDDIVPPLCKLHGSFNWENTNPVRIDDNLLTTDEEQEDKILWIPPGVIKKSDHYPFNAIWGMARFCLNCDILRIIGCSLNANDFGVISLLHTTNRLRQDDKPKYEIQFIDYPDKCQEIKERYPYLDISSIIDTPEFIKYVQEEHAIDYGAEKGDNDSEKILAWLNNKEKVNIFELWLKAFADNLITEGLNIEDTPKGLFYKFYAG